MWAGISLGYRTDLHIFKRSSVTAVRYRDKVLEPIVRLHAAAVGPTFVLIGNNARPHRADIVDDYLESEGIARVVTENNLKREIVLIQYHLRRWRQCVYFVLRSYNDQQNRKCPTDCEIRLVTILNRKKHEICELAGWEECSFPNNLFVGIPGREKADKKPKQGAESSQVEVPLTLRRAKSIISTHSDKYTAMTPKPKNHGKPWETTTPVGPIPRNLERAEVVARFRLATGKTFLRVYL
ncbi:transposable element Tcb1 transposase [Trichonephila clavipes]|nr:transposable element Tcb1 transposase [Trichonephila clavipes]